MKKQILPVLILLLACMILICTGASANSWGLKGKLYQAVEQSKAWDDYSTLSNQEGQFAVMKARYHHALFFVDNAGKLHVYTTAVYQPEDKRKAPSLLLMDQNLYLRYGDEEEYVFHPWTEDGEYLLYSAKIGDFQLNGHWEDDEIGINWYWANEGDSTAQWPVTIRLSDFNIKLLPRSVEEVRSLNLMQAQLDDDRKCLGFASGTGYNYTPDQPGELLQPKKKGTAPVYRPAKEKPRSA